MIDDKKISGETSLLKIEGLRYRYSKKEPEVLRGVDLTLEAGEIGVVLGRNGAGKTTLFHSILGIAKPTAGKVLLEGKALAEMSPKERAAKVAYVPQKVEFGGLTVYDTVLTGRLPYFDFHASREDREKVEAVLTELGLTEFAYRQADRLSGGEKQKVAIARALAGNPRLMIFDEPTGNLDLANERLLMEEARRLAEEKGVAVLCSLHGLNEALELGHRFYLMQDGKVRYSGDRSVLTREVIQDIYGVAVEILEVNHKTIITGGTIL